MYIKISSKTSLKLVIAMVIDSNGFKMGFLAPFKFGKRDHFANFITAFVSTSLLNFLLHKNVISLTLTQVKYV